MKIDMFTHKAYYEDGSLAGTFRLKNCYESQRDRGFWRTFISGWDFSKCEVVKLEGDLSG